jgi:translation initiation factor IF-1
MANTHKITVGTKVTRLSRQRFSGYRNAYFGVLEVEETIASVSTENQFRLVGIDGGTAHCSNFFKINGVQVRDGDIIEIKASETYEHNRCKVGDTYTFPILTMNIADNYAEMIVGKGTSILV